MTGTGIQHVVVMGVSGCGKTTVAEGLAAALGWPFDEGDQFHPQANIAKMSAHQPLTDADRWPWLDRMNGMLRERAVAGQSVVLGCSALRQVYRDRLGSGLADVRWVHLQGSFELIQARLQGRQHRYMPASLLQSQFTTLETPQDALAVDIGGTPDQIIGRIIAGLQLG